MSLLQNEDFLIYHLRSSYLSHIKDGVGERLITLNPAVFSTAAFRSAGYAPSPDIERTYSPPIPTAVASEYFQNPRPTRPSASADGDDDPKALDGDRSDLAVGTARLPGREGAGVSSDDSESDVEGDLKRPPLRFMKRAVRGRAGSSPVRSRAGSSPVRTAPPEDRDGRLRSGSVEPARPRPRRDTITSSEVSSENERGGLTARTRPGGLASERIAEETREADSETATGSSPSLSAGLVGSTGFAGSGLLGSLVSHPRTSSTARPGAVPAGLPLARRPVSIAPPVSALTEALRALSAKPEDPLERYATLAGSGTTTPLLVRIHAPASKSGPFNLLIRKTTISDVTVTVVDAIGFALYRYAAEGLQPALKMEDKDVNLWAFRMVEDGEVEYDFPALTRTKAFADFTLNNNRGQRGRSRDSAMDEFALVRATPAEVAVNRAAAAKSPPATETTRPVTTVTAAAAAMAAAAAAAGAPPVPPVVAPTLILPRNPDGTLLDTPQPGPARSKTRPGAPRTVTVRFIDATGIVQTTTHTVCTETYLADILSSACRQHGLSESAYVLRIAGTATVAPDDRTVEALGENMSLDLGRRRFFGEGEVTIQPGESPGMRIVVGTTPTKRGRRIGVFGLGAAGKPKQPAVGSLAGSLSGPSAGPFRRYNVIRKTGIAFTSSSWIRVLVLDTEYLHMMPSEKRGGGGAIPPPSHLAGQSVGTAAGGTSTSGKLITVPYSNIVGCKVSRRHPRLFRVVVFRERESKRYDFEAGSKAEAREIVDEIQGGMGRFRS